MRLTPMSAGSSSSGIKFEILSSNSVGSSGMGVLRQTDSGDGGERLDCHLSGEYSPKTQLSDSRIYMYTKIQLGLMCPILLLR